MARTDYFRFLDAVSIDRFRLRELVSAGKALDDQAAAMGAFAEPARTFADFPNLKRKLC